LARLRPLTAIIVGAGHRSLACAAYSLEHPERLKIVGVADLSELRRQRVARRFGLSEEQCFRSADELASKGKLADVIINGTMDHQHVPTSLPLLARGYNILLEKPFAVNEDEMWELVDTARRYQRRVMIGHVLRYAPFYNAIRKRVATGDIGEITHIETTECIAYHHVVVGYVRGKWNRKDRGGFSTLMSKCCHDLDLIAWMKSGVRPKTVASIGNRMYFRPEKAPPGAGTRCLVDCPIEPDCVYSARKHYVDHDWWDMYVWPSIEHIENPTTEDKIESLRTDNPFGRCVWQCDNDVVDHQGVIVEFADGCVATHSMSSGTPRGDRTIHLCGTKGEIVGSARDDHYVIRYIDPRPGREHSTQVVKVLGGEDTDQAHAGHGGGDALLMQDFVDFMSGRPPSIATTSIEDSISGHLIGFSANRAMEERRVVDILWRG